MKWVPTKLRVDQESINNFLVLSMLAKIGKSITNIFNYEYLRSHGYYTKMEDKFLSIYLLHYIRRDIAQEFPMDSLSLV